MKSDRTHLILFFCLFLCVGLILWSEQFNDKRLDLMDDSIKRLTMIELITEQQFNLLTDKVERLERMNGRIGMKD